MGQAGQSLVQTCCGATLTTARSVVIPSPRSSDSVPATRARNDVSTLSPTFAIGRKKRADISPPIRLGVLGDPVAHSLSPEMQNAALQECGVALRYAPFQIAPDELETAIRLLREIDFVGLNLTVPHKIAALSFVDDVEERARKIGAINTIVFRDGHSLGWNTDGPGFERAIREEFSVDLRDLRVLLLGAGGGAGRALAYQCASENCERLVLVNRTFDKAQALARELAGYFSGPRVLGPAARLEAVPWEERSLRSAARSHRSGR